MLAIQLVTSGLLSLRGASYVFKLFQPWFDGGIPCHTVIQNWVLRLGLYNLNKAKEKRKDWIYILDHTIEFGQKKCLLILGITLETFRKNKYKITHKDVEVLSVDIETTADALSVKKSLQKCSKMTGAPIQIISDHGSNIWKGVNEYIASDSRKIIQTYDVTHKASIILKKQLENNEKWKLFVSNISYTKKSLVHTILAFMAPGKAKEKARWLNLENYLLWAQSSLQQAKKKMKKNERNKFDEKVLWIKGFKRDIKEWSNMLMMLNILKNEVKTNGLSPCSLEDFDEKLKKTKIKINSAPLRKTYVEITKYLNEEINDLKGVFLGCTDIIESIFGKYKNFSAKSPMKEIGKSILTVPVFTSEITPEIIKKAMEETTTKDVNKWLKKNIGKSLLSKRREFFKLGKTKKYMKKLFENIQKTASF
jgi:hypothetical protein